MGISLEEWCAYVRAHPLKYKFRGLDGFYTSVGAAAVADERFMDKWCDSITDAEIEYLEAEIAKFEKGEEYDEIVEDFADHMRGKCFNSDLATDQAIDSAVSTDRWEFCWERVDPEPEWDYIKSKDYEPTLLDKHPIEEAWSHACGQGIEIDKVIFICPSCGTEPIDERDFALTDSDWWCGSCGASSCLGTNEDMLDFFLALEIEVYPFDTKKRNALQAKLKEREDA